MSKTILITGGSSGLGKETAKLLAPDNTVIVLSHIEDEAKEAAEELGCDYAVANVTDAGQVQSAVTQVIEKHGSLDVLINCAGIWEEGQLEDCSPERMKLVVDINLSGTMLMCQAALPHMKKQKAGMIFNIISQAGLGVKDNRTVYYASKWGVRGFTGCLQKDVQGEGIRVTAVYPGVMDTGLFDTSGHSRDLSKALDPTETAKTMAFIIGLSPNTHVPEIGLRSITEI